MIFDWERVLNPEQLKAVKLDKGPILVLAGAGSGKTRVITYRIAYLIKEKGVNPLNILAVTFTNKAADEMRTRVYQLFNNDSFDIWIRTYHSTCARILRCSSEGIGIPPNFTIYDENDQLSLIKAILKEMKMDSKEFSPEYILRAINNAKENLITPHNYSNHPMPGAIKAVYKLYNERLKEYNALDFDDLILKTIELFNEKEEILEYYRNRFQYILVDEYQDTNYAQRIFTNLLAERHRNLCVVGDDDQSIYSWRGAEIRNILNFDRDYPEAEVIKLEQNYRSTKTILRAASEVVKNNKHRKSKNIWSNNEVGERIEYYEAVDDESEAEYVVKKILELKLLGKNYGSIAIFYRMNYQSRIFEEYFIKNKIPYEVVGALKFYERPEIKNVLAYLRIINNPNDTISLKRIINQAKWNVSHKAVEKLIEYQKLQKCSLFNAMKDFHAICGLEIRTKSRLESIVKMIEDLTILSQKVDLHSLTLRIATESGYLDNFNINHSAEEFNRRKNVEELLRSIAEYVKTNPQATIEEYLEGVSLRSEIDDWSGTDRVSLMTLHNAKGLEFETVFITGLEDKIVPHYKSEDEARREEERRLFYVGITRAKKKLFLTRALQRRTPWGEIGNCRASPFLKEIPDDVFATILEPAS